VLATDLVPGDIIAIEEGDTIPADGRLIRSIALQTAEASLTGESLPVSGSPVCLHQRRAGQYGTST
jgi:P-type Ca2+ transporter type 2C